MVPNTAKIAEKVIKRRIEEFAETNPQILHPHQFGFRRGKSTIDALFDIKSTVNQKLLDKNKVALISFDVKGAFDRAWWPSIIHSMDEQNFPSSLIRLVQSYFEDRFVFTTYNRTTISKKVF